ncbi:hypothetical protein HPP92_026029 [Vanilla planifolia]|uniref:Uncharacterized protein n=1 Tax=Vanilla planifolia TaxID=51239 RepID=A0A835PGK5_VANPL|nr:hypothetical protein HPP92_026029 [Vanilla planifolia]
MDLGGGRGSGEGLLRKYDGNWEMRVPCGADAVVGLWWKGQPVSFCSLWRLEHRSTTSFPAANTAAARRN